MKLRLPARSDTVKSMALCLSLALLSAGCVPPSVATKPDNNPMFKVTNSENAESASRRTKETADWVVNSRDNRNKPFAIIDKVNAKVHVYGSDGKPYGEAPVLLGLAKGDHSVPGIGSKSYAQIKPEERTTPAGRFEAVMGKNHKGKEIVWLDYEQALSMHAVVKGIPRDRRAQRLASATPLDNRISYGCINVPVPFFQKVIQSNFSRNGGVVYILPETGQFSPAPNELLTAQKANPAE
ncbi:MAG: L,D-transpeptidase [Chromatiales bacterium]|jgi:hypothetical protein